MFRINFRYSDSKEIILDNVKSIEYYTSTSIEVVPEKELLTRFLPIDRPLHVCTANKSCSVSNVNLISVEVIQFN